MRTHSTNYKATDCGTVSLKRSAPDISLEHTSNNERHTMKLWRTLQQLGGLGLLAGLVACGGGGGSGAADNGNADTPVTEGMIATVDVTALQWGVQTPLTVSLQNATGTAASGPLSCRSEASTALSVSDDCTSAQAWRLGTFAMVVSDSRGQSARVSVRTTPQRHALMASSQSENAFGVVSSAGMPWVWGTGTNNKLAQYTSDSTFSTAASARPLAAKYNSFSNMAGVVSLAMGSASASSLALTESGDVWSWGGDGTTLGRPAGTTLLPAKVLGDSAGSVLRSVVQVQVGHKNAAALTDDGRVYTWGHADLLGQGPSVTSGRIPGLVQTSAGVVLSDVVQISAGADFTLALTRSGQVYVWGANEALQLSLGNGTRSAKLWWATPVLDPTSAQPLKDVVSVAAGGAHALALTSQGQVYAFGSNTYGQLGRGFASTGLQSLDAAKVQAPFWQGGVLSGIQAISAGQHHNLALSKSGTVYSWGTVSANDPQLGTGAGTAERQDYPRWVTSLNGLGLLDGVLSISATPTNSYALTRSGEVLSWGLNFAGALGAGRPYTELADSAVPLNVLAPVGQGNLNVGDLKAFKNPNQRYR